MLAYNQVRKYLTLITILQINKKIAISFYFYQQGWVTKEITRLLCGYINWKYYTRYTTCFSFPDNKKLLFLVLLSNLICIAIMEIMHGNVLPWKHHNISLITNTLYHNIMGSSISPWILGNFKNILHRRMTYCSALQRTLNAPWGKMTFQS